MKKNCKNCAAWDRKNAVQVSEIVTRAACLCDTFPESAVYKIKRDMNDYEGTECPVFVAVNESQGGQ